MGQGACLLLFCVGIRPIPHLWSFALDRNFRLLMMQDQTTLTRHWLACSGWGTERMSLVFSYEGGWFIRKGQWCAKVNILRITVGYLNVTINRKTWNTELEIGTDGSRQTQQTPQVDAYGSYLDLPIRCGSGFWTVLEPNWIGFPVWTRTAGGFTGPVASTSQDTWLIGMSNLRVAETSGQVCGRLPDQLRPLCSLVEDLVFYFHPSHS
jgi:hypothetical protein